MSIFAFKHHHHQLPETFPDDDRIITIRQILRGPVFHFEKKQLLNRKSLSTDDWHVSREKMKKTEVKYENEPEKNVFE